MFTLLVTFDYCVDCLTNCNSVCVLLVCVCIRSFGFVLLSVFAGSDVTCCLCLLVVGLFVVRCGCSFVCVALICLCARFVCLVFAVDLLSELIRCLMLG